MSEEGQREEQQHDSINLQIKEETAEAKKEEESAVQRLPNRTARAGALVLQAYQGRKGGISPSKVLASWTKKLVSFCIRASVMRPFHPVSLTRLRIATAQVHSIQADNTTLSSSKEALDLYEAIKTVSRSKPIALEQNLIDQVIGILQTHPVRHIRQKCIPRPGTSHDLHLDAYSFLPLC
jgi:hypothetical protein